MGRRTASVITELVKTLQPHQEQLVYMHVDQGKSPAAIAKEIDSSPSGVKNMLNRVNVQYEIEKRREDFRVRMKMTREDVVDIFAESVNMARIMSEPATMIMGAKEAGRMLGYYEPEVLKIVVSDASKSLKEQLRTLTDVELYALLEEERAKEEQALLARPSETIENG